MYTHSKERSAVGREIFAEESRPSSESDGRYFKKFATCINTSSHTKHTACYHSLSGYYLSVYHLRCVLFTVKTGVLLSQNTTILRCYLYLS